MTEPPTDPTRTALSQDNGDHRRGTLTRRRLWQLGAAATVTAGAASLWQVGTAGVASAATAQDYFDKAAELAGDDPVLLSLVDALSSDFTVPRPAAPKPMKIFDDVAVLSAGWVSATALLTSDGIILIDALNNPSEAERYIVSGLRTLGADPATIKYIVVTHGHSDHFGGAQYLADQYGARVMMAPADWNALAASNPANAPNRDLDITDGQRLTLGTTAVTLAVTPGHTSGTVSPIFPVRWRGAARTAMLWGGTKPPTSAAAKQTYLSSVLSFASRMSQARVDVELSNHAFCDYGLERMAQLRAAPGSSDNPFVLGASRTQLFMQVMENMLRGLIAQNRTGSTSTTASKPSPLESCGC
ncbi:MBL fold metallo-hydrolase [Streptomyces sp. CS131]|uniref:MBL fold metallo-hydrolase n=1 Tax=Streptomyces sp. CS131 TaxID=2162711 RepID=UPI000D50F696|nr:MBL fold metallo-hydrolase [Streptomyces sp. CS131]PVC90115.1 MBL fold metallo-hydrolase [Streptomyces sp. CS131]